MERIRKIIEQNQNTEIAGMMGRVAREMNYKCIWRISREHGIA